MFLSQFDYQLEDERDSIYIFFNDSSFVILQPESNCFHRHRRTNRTVSQRKWKNSWQTRCSYGIVVKFISLRHRMSSVVDFLRHGIEIWLDNFSARSSVKCISTHYVLLGWFNRGVRINVFPDMTRLDGKQWFTLQECVAQLRNDMRVDKTCTTYWNVPQDGHSI